MAIVYRISLFILCLSISVSLAAQTSKDFTPIEKKSQRIEQLYQLNEEIRSDKSAIDLAHEIIQHRSNYSNNSIAKAFIVLTNIAYNKGESGKAFQFVNDGLSLLGISIDVKLNLLLNLTKAHYKESRFEDVLENAEQLLKLAYGKEQTQTRIIALSYKAMALSSLGNSKKAFAILNKIELLIKNNHFSEHIRVLEILADAYLFQRDYKTAISLYNKAITLRFDFNQLTNLGQTYLSLAKAYQRSNKFDDAYNAFWESRVHAEQHDLVIQASLAQLGLGQILFAQGQLEKSYQALLEAYSVLSDKDLIYPYLDVLISLAISAKELKKDKKAEQWLIIASDVADGLPLLFEHIKLFELLAQMYNEKKQPNQAYQQQKKYLEQYKKFNVSLQTEVVSNRGLDISVINNRKLVMKLSNESDLSSNYDTKFKRQETIIFLLSVLIIVLLTVFFVWSIRRAKKIGGFSYDKANYDDGELASPQQTKQLYQFTFKMARKYQYPLTISYIVVENWNELVFHFDKKTVKEVHQTISSLIREYVGEFDHAGKINDGEYILMCPHQSSEIIQISLERLAAALKARFFANIGDFSVKIKYSCDMPSVQDIDPYLFLSRLSESYLSNTSRTN